MPARGVRIGPDTVLFLSLFIGILILGAAIFIVKGQNAGLLAVGSGGVVGALFEKLRTFRRQQSAES